MKIGKDLSAIDNLQGISSSSAKPPPSDSQQMEEHGITFDGARYAYGEYKYDRLSDAVSYAKLQNKRSPSEINQHQEPSTQWLPSWGGALAGPVNNVFISSVIFRRKSKERK